MNSSTSSPGKDSTGDERHDEGRRYGYRRAGCVRDAVQPALRRQRTPGSPGGTGRGTGHDPHPAVALGPSRPERRALGKRVGGVHAHGAAGRGLSPPRRGHRPAVVHVRSSGPAACRARPRRLPRPRTRTRRPAATRPRRGPAPSTLRGLGRRTRPRSEPRRRRHRTQPSRRCRGRIDRPRREPRPRMAPPQPRPRHPPGSAPNDRPERGRSIDAAPPFRRSYRRCSGAPVSGQRAQGFPAAVRAGWCRSRGGSMPPQPPPRNQANSPKPASTGVERKDWEPRAGTGVRTRRGAPLGCAPSIAQRLAAQSIRAEPTLSARVLPGTPGTRLPGSSGKTTAHACVSPR